MSTYLEKQIRRSNRNLFIPNLILFCLMAWILWEYGTGFLPYIASGHPVVIFGAGMCVLFISLAAWNLKKWNDRRKDPSRSLIAKHAQKYGSYAAIANSIDEELASPHAQQINSVRITYPGCLSHRSTD